MKKAIAIILVLAVIVGMVIYARNNRPNTKSDDYYEGYAEGYRDGKNENTSEVYGDDYKWKLEEVDEKLNKIEGMIEEFDDAGYDLDDIYAAIIEVRDYINKK